MIATYQEHIIEAIREGDGLYHATVDGQDASIKPTPYKRTAIKRAMQAIDEQARSVEVMKLKEAGL